MRSVIFALTMAVPLLAACAQQKDRDIRGMLNHHGALTLRDCGTGKVYWVRAGDNRLSSLQGRMRDLSGNNGTDIVAEIRGEIIDLSASEVTAYPVHGTLWASRVISIEPGDC